MRLWNWAPDSKGDGGNLKYQSAGSSLTIRRKAQTIITVGDKIRVTARGLSLHRVMEMLNGTPYSWSQDSGAAKEDIT